MTSPGHDGNKPAKLPLVIKAIQWAYDSATGALPGLPDAIHFAEGYRERHNGDIDAAINDMVKWQVGQAGIAGFVTGMGGAITVLPGIAANLASVLYLQLRMIAAIAHLRGYDVRSENVRAFGIACLAGSSATDVLKDAGIKAGTKVTARLLLQIPGAVIVQINKAVGFRLMTKAGGTGVVNLSKFLPLVGGVVSGALDAATTKAIAEVARQIFKQRDPADDAESTVGGPSDPAGGPIIDGEALTIPA